MENGVYVKIDQFNEVEHTLRLIKGKLNDAKADIEKIKSLKDREDAELASWAGKLAEIEEKVSEMDRSLSSPGA
ncbi:hypothetical protein HYU14_03765 [Candidatus Woesearchaeota archaeon]|nr:hypothetical protein [Candidatus Woesearchaeota archaeon]